MLDVPTCASGSSAAAPTRPASASRSRTRGCARRSSRRSSSTRPATSASTRRSRRTVGWSHEIAPWIVFFQNVDAIVGPDEPVVYPEHLTEELDYELELAVVLKKAGKWFPPEEAADYIGGYVIFNDITARDIQRREMRSGVFSFCKAIDTFCPLGPWIVTPDEIPDPHDLAMELRVNGEARQTSHSGRMSVTIPEILSPLLGARLLGGRRALDRDGERRGRLLPRTRLALPPAGRRDRGRDRADRRAAESGCRLGGGARRAAPPERITVVVGEIELVPLVDAVGRARGAGRALSGARPTGSRTAISIRSCSPGRAGGFPVPRICSAPAASTVLVDTGVGPAGLWGWKPSGRRDCFRRSRRPASRPTTSTSSS